MALAGVALAGCGNETSSPKAKPTEETHAKVAGVDPDHFECRSILTLAQLTEILGAPTRAVDSASSIPKGVPRPCTYEVATTPPEMWTFDFDCRDGYKKRADALFAQYKQINEDRIERYNELSDAGVPKPKPTNPDKTKDAGVVELHPPGEATRVDVGAKGLDHNDQGLLFIDDDAPCYVRVVGRDAARRLALAKAVAKHLTFVNAPMSPRPLK